MIDRLNQDSFLTMVIDHGMLTSMETVSVSEFKATCLALLQKVKRTGQPILITRRGEPIAQVVPPPPLPSRENWLGCMKGTIIYMGDVVSPVMDEDDWEAAR